jgi:SHAQKYF class myb-like DNA-binding protein
MSDVIINDATVIEGLEACFFDDDFVQSDVMRGKESTGEMEASMLQPDMILNDSRLKCREFRTFEYLMHCLPIFNGTAGRWTIAEHEMFVKGLEAHSKQWKLIAELIKTRTVVQVRTHAQKYFQKLLKQAKNDGSNISEDAFADMFNDTSSDVRLLLERTSKLRI